MPINRQYKDSTFRLLFNNEPENATSLCNSTSQDKFDAKDIVFDPVGGLFIDELRHDVACRFGDKIIFIYEHQSTYDENIPIRMLLEAAEIIKRYIKSLGARAIHSKKRIALPSIEFILLCNGQAARRKLEKEMHLRDFFQDARCIDLTVKVYDISYSPRRTILKECPILREYSQLVHKVEQGKKSGLSDEVAIKKALVYCKKKHILTDFLKKHEQEVEQVMLFEWNIDDALAASREDGFEDGVKNGILSSIRNLMETLGFSAQKAMDALKISPAEQARFMPLLQ